LAPSLVSYQEEEEEEEEEEAAAALVQLAALSS
jgi:hypothetical protein